MEIQFLTENQAAELLQVSDRTLQRYRKDGTHQLGVHYQKLPGGGVRYVQGILENWMINLNDPDAHQQAIEEFRRSVAAGKRKRNRSV